MVALWAMAVPFQPSLQLYGHTQYSEFSLFDALNLIRYIENPLQDQCFVRLPVTDC